MQGLFPEQKGEEEKRAHQNGGWEVDACLLFSIVKLRRRNSHAKWGFKREDRTQLSLML